MHARSKTQITYTPMITRLPKNVFAFKTFHSALRIAILQLFKKKHTHLLIHCSKGQATVLGHARTHCATQLNKHPGSSVLAPSGIEMSGSLVLCATLVKKKYRTRNSTSPPPSPRNSTSTQKNKVKR